MLSQHCPMPGPTRTQTLGEAVFWLTYSCACVWNRKRCNGDQGWTQYTVIVTHTPHPIDRVSPVQGEVPAPEAGLPEALPLNGTRSSPNGSKKWMEVHSVYPQHCDCTEV